MSTKNKNKQGISLCMIVRDEEWNIEKALSSARPYVDQVVVVDTGSKDNTIQIAKNYADTLEHFKWVDDFSAARNYSLQFATQPWILVLDADEVIESDGFLRLRELSQQTDFDGFYLIERMYCDNTESDDASWKPTDRANPYSRVYGGYRDNNKILRFFRNSADIRFSGRIHEIVTFSIQSDRICESGIVIHHYHDNPENPTERHVQRNLKIQEALISERIASGRDYLSAGTAHLYFTGNLDKATEYLFKALQLGEDTTVILEGLAEVHYRSARFDIARDMYQRLYDAGQGSSAVLNNLSNLQLKIGDLQGSARLLEELLERGVDVPERKQRIEKNLAVLRLGIEQSRSDEKQMR